jgi:hypothetical protein
MVCRGLLLMLERAGQIELPPVSYVRHNPLANRARPEPVRIDTTPIEGGLRNLQPLEFELVRRTGKEPLWNSLLAEHHYLGYEQPVGEHLKYLVWGQGRPVACLAWCSAPRHLGSRDRYIGWNAEERRRNVRFLAYNTRFLILPWVKVEHLASHILGRMASRISADWQWIYGTRFTFWRRLSIPNDSAEPVTVRPTGWCWARRRDVVNNRIATCRTGRSKKFWDIHWRSSFASCSWGQDEKRQTANRCKSGRTGPGAGRSAASAVERGRLREAQGGIARAGGDAGAAAQHGEDQRRTGKIGRLGTQRRDSAGDRRFFTARTWTQWCWGVCQFAED